MGMCLRWRSRGVHLRYHGHADLTPMDVQLTCPTAAVWCFHFTQFDSLHVLLPVNRGEALLADCMHGY